MTVAEDDIKAYGRVVARAFLTKVTVRQVVESAEAAANRRASTTIFESFQWDGCFRYWQCYGG